MTTRTQSCSKPRPASASAASATTPTTPVPPALIPDKARPDGPVTTRKLRRTVAGYLAVATAGTVLARLAGRDRAANLGTGFVAPGAGYLTAGKPGRFLATQAGFAGSLALWLGSGNVLAPLVVWTATALAGLRHDVRSSRAATAVPLAAAAALGLAAGARKRGYRGAIARREKRNAYLRELGAGSAPSWPAVMFPHTVAAPDVPELTEEQLGLARFALDRALQPVPEFEGYDKIEQFQTSSIRYQVAVNGYALTALQYAHTPAFHGYLSLAQRNCIAKWQERICWAFWSKESLWGHLRYNPNPIPRDDIMVSGWLGNLVAGYTATTGDHRYTRPGSISFKHPRGMSYDYDIHSLTQVLAENFEKSEYGLFPCEPNWIYALCNGFGILPLPVHDRLYGTDYSHRILPSFREGFENEFVSPDGRVIGLRSKWTGLTVPAMTSIMSDASVIWQIHPIFPDIARRQWAILREEFVGLGTDGLEVKEPDVPIVHLSSSRHRPRRRPNPSAQGIHRSRAVAARNDDTLGGEIISGATRVAIVGCGFGGLAAAIEMKRSGVADFTVYEKAASAGGVWRENTYPGAACDVPSPIYSFSYALKPDWSALFGQGHEIKHYLDTIVDEFGLREHIQFGTEVVAATFDEKSGTWTLDLANGSQQIFDVVVMATGQLSRPKMPQVEDLDLFEGASFHSAEYDHSST